jgi:tetratricopeptide (TPR) repeat protein
MLRAGTLSAVVEAARFASAQGAGGAFTDDLLGEAARLSGDYSRAVTHFEHALEARTGGEPDLVGTARATTLQGLAYSLMKRGESGRAAEFAEQALREAGDADHDLIARILNTAAILRYRGDRLTEALSAGRRRSTTPAGRAIATLS